jgi:hypothetical protein
VRNRRFESTSLQWRVLCEPLFNARQTGLDMQQAVQEKLALLACYPRGSMGELAVAYQTAWTMAHKLRHGLSEDSVVTLAYWRTVNPCFSKIGRAAGDFK